MKTQFKVIWPPTAHRATVVDSGRAQRNKRLLEGQVERGSKT